MASKLTHLFDIRNVIGALLAIYGVILTIAGFAPGLLRERDKGRKQQPGRPVLRHRGELVGGARPDRGGGRVHRLGVAASGACRGDSPRT